MLQTERESVDYQVTADTTSNPNLFSTRCLNNNEMIKRRMEAQRSSRGGGGGALQIFKEKAESDSNSQLQIIHNSNP